jgi:glycerol-3-phosphate dehydrogenase
MTRDEMLRRFHARSEWDVVIVGGGATGTGVAIDSAARGYSTLLVEQSDFGKGTSSRSTKLVHGGVRYLEQGNLRLVMEALRERGLLLQNAPHLVHNLGFVVPSYDWWEAPFYGAGLKLYNLLAGKYRFGPSLILSREETLQRLPSIRTEGLRGGVIYYDGQFDDSRLLIHMVATAYEQGAALLNYAQAIAVARDGVRFRDLETGREFDARARVVINAAGPFSDAIRRMADPSAEPAIAPSQGVHLVFDQSYLPGDSAIMVPHTSDGRVMFAIPWHGHTLVGTTDTPVAEAPLEPVAFEEEIEFILQTAGLYLERKPTRADILSVWAGIRPLSAPGSAAGKTSAISRDHTIRVEPSGILTITGGKWTTYRRMAEHCVDEAAALGGLPASPGVTRDLPIHGADSDAARFGHLSVYGSDAARVQEIGAPERLHPALPYTEAEVIWAARSEMARTVEDVLSRRTRALLLNARAAIAMAPRVAAILAREFGRGSDWESEQVAAFGELARNYLPPVNTGPTV